MAKLTRPQRARRYLEASQNAGYTGLPAEHREAYEAQMRAHERAYPGVRAHALAGTGRDFDKPLAAGTREHQRHLRDKEGLSEGQIQDMRKELRSNTADKGSASARRTSSSALAPARAAAGAGANALSEGAGVLTGKRGNLLLQIIGLGLLLCLIYLVVAGKGVGALAGISQLVTGAVGAFIKPEDPIAKLESALGSTQATQGTAATGGKAPENAAELSAAAGSKLAPAPSKVKVKTASSAEVAGFNKGLAEYQRTHPNLKVSHLGG